LCVCLFVCACLCACECITWYATWDYREVTKKRTLHSLTTAAAAAAACSFCVRAWKDKTSVGKSMKVCGQHLQRLHAMNFNKMCGYMCCGGHIDPSVCLSLIYMRISPAFFLYRCTRLLCEDTGFVCGKTGFFAQIEGSLADRGLFIQGAFAAFVQNESIKRPQTRTRGLVSAVFGNVCASITGCR